MLACGTHRLVFTDADTRVSLQWLAAQLALGVDVVCGSVELDDWSPHGATAQQLRKHCGRRYRDRHAHIHGARGGFGDTLLAMVAGPAA